MAISALGHEPFVRRSVRHRDLDYEKLEAAVALGDEGRPVDALVKVLEHLFPDATIPDLTKEPFVFAQGSSRVSVKLEGDDLSITVPLVRLPEGGKSIAAMRYVLSNIAASGQLYQPRLRGDDVLLEFREPVARMHAAKVLEVLRRMPMEADENDDFLVSEFGAHPLGRVAVAPLTDEEIDRAKRIWQMHWDEIDELHKECRRKRSMFFLNELTAYAFHRILVALPLCGIVGHKLDKNASIFNDGNEDPMKREAALGKCVKEMKALSLDELVKSLGHAEYAISPKGEGTPGILHRQLENGDYLDDIGRMRSKDRVMDATLARIGKQKLGELFRFLLSAEHAPFAFDLMENTIRLVLTFHMSDVFASRDAEALSKQITHFLKEADRYDNVLIESYGCEPAPDTQLTFLKE